jgi:DNA-binding MarR family transcriptional regulator
MTPPGRALAAEAERTVDHELAQLLGDLSAAEQRALASIASKVVGSSPALDR